MGDRTVTIAFHHGAQEHSSRGENLWFFWTGCVSSGIQLSSRGPASSLHLWYSYPCLSGEFGWSEGQAGSLVRCLWQSWRSEVLPSSLGLLLSWDGCEFTHGARCGERLWVLRRAASLCWERSCGAKDRGAGICCQTRDGDRLRKQSGFNWYKLPII